jgi:hypothetical protein
MGSTKASANQNDIVFEAKTAFRSFKPVPGQDPKAQTGEITGAGVMNSSFVTLAEPPLTTIFDDEFDPVAGTGLIVIRHTDRYESKNATHLDDSGVKRPDSFEVPYTIVAIIASPQHAEVTFIGPLSAGTGMFSGATGVLYGHANQVASSDPAIDRAFDGRIGGNVHFA